MPNVRPYRLTESIATRLRADTHRIVITGAGGWLGLATLELIESAIGDDIHRRVICFGASERKLLLRSGRQITQQMLTTLPNIRPEPTFVIHFAFLTKDKVAEMDDATYSAANKAISASVRAALDTIGATGVFVASSGAARSAEDPTASHDMQLYGSLKKYEEDIFSQWTTDTGKLAIITRIFNVTGPYMNKLQSYAYSSFILDALANRPISVRAPHRVIRGYVAIKELMSLVFAILLDGKPDVFRFDTGGPPQELEEVAHSVSHALGSVPVMRAEIQSDATDHYVGDKQRYDTLLTQYSIHSVSAEEGIRDTAEFLIATQ